MPPAPRHPAEPTGHMDHTPDDIVFRDGRAAALIDFDLSEPVAVEVRRGG
ncbi:hypothetical protein [Streptosporangium sandarakinum]